MTTPEKVRSCIEGMGGKIDEMGRAPDGSGWATASFPLRKDHWLYTEDDAFEAPPMPFCMGTDDPQREEWKRKIVAAGRYAIRAATMNGKDDDFDPDALVQNLVVGMLGYHTPDGLSPDEWANPKE